MVLPEVKILLILLLGFQLKHFLCDFPLQNIGKNFMIINKSSSKFSEWFSSLLIHGSIHGFVTALFLSFVLFIVVDKQHLTDLARIIAAYIVFAEIVLHMIIDRIKAHKNLGGRWTPDNKKFWWALGIDQMAHQICYIAFSALVVFSLTPNNW